MSFGERLKQARLEKDLRQSELAELLGVSNSAIANYETEVSSPKEEILLKIFDILQVTPNFLFQDSYTVDKENDFYTPKEKNIVNMYRKLNDSGKEKAEDYINDLSTNPNYKIDTLPRKEKETDEEYAEVFKAAYTEPGQPYFEPGKVKISKEKLEKLKKAPKVTRMEDL